jgi:hypothetical protein
MPRPGVRGDSPGFCGFIEMREDYFNEQISVRKKSVEAIRPNRDGAFLIDGIIVTVVVPEGP